MNSSVIIAVLQTILNLIPTLTDNKTINSIINMLIQIVPIVIKEAQEVMGPIKNIIEALSEKDAITDEQMAVLKALNEQVDQAYADAWDAYLASHPDTEGKENG
jgi:hypothetical protein